MLFNGKFWNKPGHLGMTTEEVKAALAKSGEMAEVEMINYETAEKISLNSVEYESMILSIDYNTLDNFMTNANVICKIRCYEKTSGDETFYDINNNQTFRIVIDNTSLASLLTDGTVTIVNVNEGAIKAPYNITAYGEGEVFIRDSASTWMAWLKKVVPEDYQYFTGWGMDSNGTLIPLLLIFNENGKDIISFTLRAPTLL